MGDFNYPEIKLQKRRINLLIFLLFAFGAVLVMRLIHLQLVKGTYYKALAIKAQSRKFEIPAKRGEIMAFDGERLTPLALNQTFYLLYADPSLISTIDRRKVAQKLAQLTGDETADFEAKLSQGGEYAVLKSKVEAKLAEEIRALKLRGIGLSEREYRTYPEGDLASQVMGFVNAEGAGQYGIEAFFNRELSGRSGLLKAITDTQGNPIPTADNVIKEPLDGSDLVLTIDRNIQAQAEKHLREGVKAVSAKSGSVVVVDPTSGRILAMANYPSFDPAEFQSVKDYNLFGNSVISSLFEPGSGFKFITMSAGLDSGKVTPDTAYEDTGSFEANGYTVKNAEGKTYGRQTMADVIQKSLNTGVIFVLKQLGGDPEKITPAGKKLFYEYITKRFGFGQKTGITLPAEASGFIPIPGSRDINYANMTFGQGLSATVMQMTMAATAVANEGKLYQPLLVDRIVAPDGKVSQNEPNVINPQVISAKTASDLRGMMINVVEHGSGWAAKMPGYKIAGKTGTAQIPRADGKGYDDKKNIGSFVGFLPADNPRFVMMVRINEPNVSGFAESTTVPVFAKIAKFLVTYLGIPPS